MGWVDQVPRAGKLYIGGLSAIFQKPDLFTQAGITHILSVVDYNVSDATERYQHLHLRLDDNPNENILKHFNESNQFIDDALNGGGGVFVHCAMGKSRSAAFICAYLIQKHGKSPESALAQVCEGRPVASPNPGFMEQLDVYDDMLKAGNQDESERIYQKWLKEHYTGSWWNWDRRYSKL